MNTGKHLAKHKKPVSNIYFLVILLGNKEKSPSSDKLISGKCRNTEKFIIYVKFRPLLCNLPLLWKHCNENKCWVHSLNQTGVKMVSHLINIDIILRDRQVCLKTTLGGNP